MKVVVDGEESESVTIDSGVPKGQFLVHYFWLHVLVAGCDIGVLFSVSLGVRLSVNIYVEVRHLCQSSTFMSKLVF